MPTPLMQLHLQGPPEAVLPNGTRHTLADADALLLAYLALHGPCSREHLASLLWPGSEGADARNTLRQRLFRLKRQLGMAPCEGGVHLTLANVVAHDLAGHVPLLGNLNLSAGSELGHWLQAERQRRAGLRAEAMLGEVDVHEQQGRLAPALSMALDLVAEQPVLEAAHQRVMRLHYLRGERAQALAAFDRCEQALKHELGTRPSPATLQLLAQVESTQPDAAGERLHRPTALPMTLLQPPLMVGREREQQRLHEALAAGMPVLVVGEAGIGKSRLLNSLSLAAQAQGLGMLTASARPGDALVPYASLGRLVRAALSAGASPPTGDALRELALLVPELDAAAPLAGTSRRSNGRHALVQAVQDLLASAQACVLDDLHFADAASLELLQLLLAQPRGSTAHGHWCLGLRPPIPGSSAAALMLALQTVGPLAQIELQPLALPALVALVHSLGLAELDAQALAPKLLQRTGGNPLFVLETLKRLWAEGSDAASTLPQADSLAQLLAQQLGQLSPFALALARCAAVAGLDFSIPLAEAVLGRPVLELADAWGELEQRRIIVGTAFAHDMVLETTLAGVPEVIARHLHAQVAVWLQAHSGEPARVAAHWEASGQRERALPSLRLAAERAHAALRENERIELLLRAADIALAAGQQEEAFTCLERAVETHMNAIRQANGLPLLEQLDALAASPLQRARALGLRAWYRANLNQLDEALAAGSQAVALAETLDEPVLLARLRHQRGTVLGMLGRFDEAVAQVQAAQPWVEGHFAPDERIEFEGHLAVLLDNLGQPEEAKVHHERALGDSLSHRDLGARATALANAAVNRLNAGQAGQAQALLADAQAIVSGYELSGSSAGFIAHLQAQCARFSGRFNEAQAWCERAMNLLQTSNPAWLPLVRLQQAQTWADLGQWARAQQALDEAPLPPRHAARRWLLRARLQAMLGRDPAQALRQAQAAAPASGWPEVRWLVRLEAAMLQGAAQAPAGGWAAELQAMALSAQGVGMHAAELSAWAALACAAVGAPPAVAAKAAAHAAALLQADCANSEGVHPAGLTVAACWCAVAQGLRASGQTQAARDAASQGGQWLRERAQRHVAEPYRESFLQRVPLHRELLTWR